MLGIIGTYHFVYSYTVLDTYASLGVLR